MDPSDFRVGPNPLRSPVEVTTSAAADLSCSARILPSVLSPIPRRGGLVLSIILRDLGDLPRTQIGSALALHFSGLAQRSLALRPAGSQIALSNLLSRQLQRFGYPGHCGGSYRGGSTVPRVELSSTGFIQLSRRTRASVVRLPVSQLTSSPGNAA